MQTPFGALGLDCDAALQQALHTNSIVSPTPVQQTAVPLILTQRDVCVSSTTGSGKTLAYLLPILQRARKEPDYRAVILAPTPELAAQILHCAQLYAQGPRCLGLLGGGSIVRQKDALKKHPQILVGTPGRILDLLFDRKVKTRSIGTWVLDEIDAILASQHVNDLYEICSRPEFAPQIICASATVGPAAQRYIERFMAADHHQVTIAGAALQHSIEHFVVPFTAAHKDVTLVRLLRAQRIDRALCFVNKLQHVGHLYRFLSAQGVACSSLSSERSKQERQAAVMQLRKGVAQVVIATDAAARGLDFPGMQWVLQYEMARDAAMYLHRAGRVGRAGATGRSAVFVSPAERGLLRQYTKEHGIVFTTLSDETRRTADYRPMLASQSA